MLLLLLLLSSWSSSVGSGAGGDRCRSAAGVTAGVTHYVIPLPSATVLVIGGGCSRGGFDSRSFSLRGKRGEGENFVSERERER